MTTTDTFFIAKVSGEWFHGFLNGGTDGAETEIKNEDIAGALEEVGKHYRGKTLQYIAFQCSDGSILATAKLYAKGGGVVFSFVGNERTTWPEYNLEIPNLNIPMEDGMKLKINTTD